tara:strand:+ start:308 stop:517 length:210 start_codon:yes stop_codon:yes gene_type:complete
MTESKSFETNLQELESIVNQLEQGELSLDDALKKFEEGVKLARFCQKTLNKAELKIKTITQNEDTQTDE